MTEPFIEHLNEKVCFKIPSSIPEEELPAVLSAVQSYVKDAYEKNEGWNSIRPNYKRIYNLDLSIVCEEPLYAQFIQDVIKSVAIYPDAQFRQWDLDFYRELDRERALTLAAATNRPAAQAYGMLLGSDAKSLPDLSGISYARGPELDVLIVEYNAEEQQILGQLLASILPGVKIAGLNKRLTYTHMLGMIVASKLVIGRLSLETYIAAALGKAVIEFYPKDMNRSWLSKWSNKLYRQIIGNEIDQDVLAVCVEKLWKIQSLPPPVKPNIPLKGSKVVLAR